MKEFYTFDDYINDENHEELLNCIVNGVEISGEVIEELICNYDDNDNFTFVDEYYDDFVDSGRWSIGKYYVFEINGNYYQCFEQAGLTEMQSSEYPDQTFEPVSQVLKTVSVWETKGE